MASNSIVVIGGGINGLVAATVLAKSGLKPLLLERSSRVGGIASTVEIAPGFRCPAVTHTVPMDRALVRTLGLERHGLQIVSPGAHVFAPTMDGAGLVLWNDAARAAQEIKRFSTRDAERYPAFLECFSRIAAVLRAVHDAVPPSIDGPNAGDLIELLKTGRKFRSLGRANAYRLLRWMPMAAADLVAEWFESEPLRAAVAAGGVAGSFLGPWSAGSGALLMLLGATDGQPFAPGLRARGGPGAVADALAAAARQAGATLRTDADVTDISVVDGAAKGVVLSTGESIEAATVLSSVDPKRTLLGLVGATHLTPDFVRRIQNIRAHGTLAKVNLAVSRLPPFAGSDGSETERAASLSGRIRLAPDIDAIERAFDAAKYGRIPDEPWIELTIPSIADPGLAPAGAHTVSAYVQFAPYHLRDTSWNAERERLGDLAVRTIGKYAPGFESSVVARQTIAPPDLESAYGLSGGHIFQGELVLDQYYVTRPLLGWARYGTPIDGLYLCGDGTHPGPAAAGRSGALAAGEIVKVLKRSTGLR